MLPASLRHNYMSTAMDRAREQTGIDFTIDFPIGHRHLRGGPVLHLGEGLTPARVLRLKKRAVNSPGKH
jgi:hypothetical protein